MSRSYKKPILKDNKYREYWRVIRREWKQSVKDNKEPRDRRLIVNDYNYMDWKFYVNESKWKRK
ncbi:MAG: hypothetical protein KAQ85_04220 [Thermodesulfovibrionia bacterium]|nr:hypothetical protein [Thermodesulfovibrionia bacterium]